MKQSAPPSALCAAIPTAFMASLLPRRSIASGGTGLHVARSRDAPAPEVDSLAHDFDEGATAEQIQDSVPSLTLREIYAAIAHYLEHRTQVGEYLKARSEEAAAVRRAVEDRQDPAIRARIRARRDHLARP
jgi:hypothetical protein